VDFLNLWRRNPASTQQKVKPGVLPCAYLERAPSCRKDDAAFVVAALLYSAAYKRAGSSVGLL